MTDAVNLKLPATIDVATARLPAAYENAKTALAQCDAIDQCQDMADKAQALASYARQANDPELRQMADRIQARAIRRCGELLRQIEPQQGVNQNIQDGTVPKVTRTKAADDAGLSERQRKTALRVANVPAAEFEKAVESPTPPTVTTLAERGTGAKKAATKARGGATAPLNSLEYPSLKDRRRFLSRIGYCAWWSDAPAEFCSKAEENFRAKVAKPAAEQSALSRQERANLQMLVERVDRQMGRNPDIIELLGIVKLHLLAAARVTS
jgi:hypothetical protein